MNRHKNKPPITNKIQECGLINEIDRSVPTNSPSLKRQKISRKRSKEKKR
jgi:hypothetical protein